MLLEGNWNLSDLITAAPIIFITCYGEAVSLRDINFTTQR